MSRTHGAPRDDDSAPLIVGDSEIGGADTAARKTLLTMVVEAMYSIKYKSLAFLFLLFILITSDVFASLLLKKMSGAIDDRGLATPYGTVIQGLVLVVGYMVLNFFIDQGVI
jgi:hypothetical protein